jgi:hypothetical protein
VLDGLDPAQPSKTVGKIAHICASSPGGPRYEATMTSAERAAAGNLIYLCSDHHDAIDTFIDTHPRDLLLRMKSLHEESVRRAIRFASGNLTYEALAVVCSVVASQAVNPIVDVELSLPTQVKIDLNGLGESAKEMIETGLAQAARVQQFVAFQSTQEPNFERRLVARVKADYEEGIASALTPDDLFDFVVEKALLNAGPRDTPDVRAAALAVVALFFEICEIFKRE